MPLLQVRWGIENLVGDPQMMKTVAAPSLPTMKMNNSAHVSQNLEERIENLSRPDATMDVEHVELA